MKRWWTNILAFLTLTACEGFFGKKTDLSFIDPPDFNVRDVAYVPIQPIIEGFAEPTDVVAGYDDLIYVVDAGSEEIIAFDKAGSELGRKHIPGVRKIAQDRRLELLAIGTVDTVINNVNRTLSTIYRLSLIGNGGYGLRYARVVKRLVHPFYFRNNFQGSDEQTRFTAIDVMADNSYYVSRTGPSDLENQIGGPDDGLVIFNAEDRYISNVFVTTASGFSRGYFKTPLCVTTLAKPPQSALVNESRDFFVAMGDPSAPIKVQSFEFIETEFGSSYEVKQLSPDTSQADDYLYRPGRFIQPFDMWLTGDGTNYLFVVDSEKDSLYQFTTRGFEGVNPPPGSSASKNIITSFGGRGQGPMQFHAPSAVTYLDKIVYVCDKNNGRLLRFKLTTDFD
ncbi:MAG: hypothetical protein Kow0075_00670 [Salibacteraceae bacterium]